MGIEHALINNKYQILSKIADGGMSSVYAAEDVNTKQRVAVKILHRKNTSSRIEDIIRFKNEANTVSKLHVREIVKIHELGETEDLHYIVMDFLEGKSLHQLLAEGVDLSIDDTIQIVVKLCNALKSIHNENVIHRDLKPGNVIIDFTPQMSDPIRNVTLIDFGLAQIKEMDLNESPEIVGTFYYMSPEQCGAIKRNIDERSDLYSLGITFYQLLTGRIPFKGSSITSVIHQHIAKIPDRVRTINPDVPVILEKIIHKLLEKEPEKRYQSALGLLKDLERIQNGMTGFELGLDDKAVSLNYKTVLVGRDDEFAGLKRKFAEAKNCKGSVFLIGGEAGRGKTRLTEELREYVQNEKSVFIGGKCFSGRNKVPYAPFKEALNEYIKIFHTYPIEKRKNITEKLRDSLGELGQVVLGLNPAMEEIIGSFPPLVPLEAVRENTRFLKVLRGFLYNLAALEGALVLFVDDLHWSDDGTFDLLLELLKEIKQESLFIIGTYRDNEIVIEHGLTYFVKTAELHQYPLKNITLEIFDNLRMKNFIAKLLFDSEENTEEISSFIFPRSKGNPFFATEILKELINENAIIRKNDKWALNTVVLRKIEVPETVVDLLIKKIQLLKARDITLLSYAAVIGSKFDMKLLLHLGILDKVITVLGVDRAIKMQLLERDIHERSKLVFVHNKIQEAFYKNIDKKEISKIHLKVASAIETLNRDSIENVIFDLAYHYIEGNNKEKALHYAYPAAKQARNNFANEESIKYFMIVKELLEERNRRGSEIWIDCVRNIGELYSVTGKTDKAIRMLSSLEQHLSNMLEKAQLYKEICHVYWKKGDWENCEAYGIKGLNLLGEKVPKSRFNIYFRIAIDYIRLQVSRIFPGGKQKFKSNKEQKKAQIIAWIYSILSWTYSQAGNWKVATTSFKLAVSAERYLPDSRELGMGYMTFAMFLAELPDFSRAYRYHQLALEVRRKVNDPFGIAQSFQMIGYYHKCKGEYKQSIECFKSCIDLSRDIGDIAELTGGLSGLAGAYINISQYSNALKVNEEYAKFASEIQDTFGLVVADMHYILIYTELGNWELAEYYGLQAYQIATAAENAYLTCISATVLGRFYLAKRDISKALQYLEEARTLFEENGKFLREYTIALYPQLAEVYIALYEEEKDLQPASETRKMLRKIHFMCKLALKNTKLWLTSHILSLRVMGKYYGLRKKRKKGELFFWRAIKLSKSLDRPYETALCMYEYSIFLQELGDRKMGQNHLETAYNGFKKINAKEYEKRCADLLGIKDDDESIDSRFMTNLHYYQRLSSLISVSQDISSILDLDVLLQKVLDKAIEVTGAESGYVMLQSEETKELEIKVFQNINKEETEVQQLSTHIAQKVLQKGEPVITTNALEDDEFAGFKSVVDYGLKSILCVPIKYKDTIKGVCYLANPLSSSVFTAVDVDVLNVLMIQAAISIENARLYKLAITDGLTNVFNYRHFHTLFKKELERAVTYNQYVSIIMLDIDHFKRVNDTYGHQFGDVVLKYLTKTMKEFIGHDDIIGRCGGEEFAILLPETDVPQAMQVAENIRLAIEQTRTLVYEEEIVQITVSSGVATFPIHKIDADTLKKAADDALYMSKKNGRNLVTLYTI